MLTWETKWLRGASSTPDLLRVIKFENPDARTVRQIQRPGKIEDHVLTGHAFSIRGAQPVPKGEAEPSDTKEKVTRSLKMVRKSQLCRGITVSSEPGIESVKLRWNSVETVRS